MARIRISIAFLSVVVLGAWVLPAVDFSPAGSASVPHRGPSRAGSASTAAATTPAATQPSGRGIVAAPAGDPPAPRTPGHTLARPRVASLMPAAPRPFTGLHMTFPRTWRSVTYEVRGPQKPSVRLVCPCPEDNATQTSADQSAKSEQAPANGAPSDARVTLLEWNP